jgi:hypothetical protein
MKSGIKLIIFGIVSVVAFIALLTVNPFSINDGGSRTVVQQTGGDQFVRFAPGVFYAGFFAKETEWPNQISVTYQADKPNLDLEDNGIEIGHIGIMFNDGTRADVKGITQFVLPADEKDMILIHNTHRTPQSLVQKRLSTFTKECLQSSAQLMSSDKHYGGGRAQMSQDFLDQLKGGVYLSRTEEQVVYDSVEHEKKRLYMTVIQLDKKSGLPKRKNSAIAEYGITVADASIVDTDYEEKVDQKLVKIIDAATKAAISRQDLMTAQQQTLTAKAKGEQALVEIEYKQKQEQTKQVVEAQTKVEVAKQDLLQQDIQLQASYKEALKKKTIAEADAYTKKTAMMADGALQVKINALIQMNKDNAAALSQYTGAISPQIIMGGGNSLNGYNAMQNFVESQTIQAMRQLNLDMKIK